MIYDFNFYSTVQVQHKSRDNENQSPKYFSSYAIIFLSKCLQPAHSV